MSLFVYHNVAVYRLKREQAAEWSAFRDYELQEMDTEDISNGIDFR